MAFTYGKLILWCSSWWHKVRYGSVEVRTSRKTFGRVELFCKKCGGKTGGYDYGKLLDITFNTDK